MNTCFAFKLTNTIKKGLKTLLYTSVGIKFLILAFLVITSSLSVQAQLYGPSNPGGFGIDGDIHTDERLLGSFDAAGSDDWYKRPGAVGTGLAIFDTAGAANYKPRLSAGENLAFYKKMQFAPYSVQNGNLMLDGTYSRDNYGYNTTSKTDKSMMDKTVFVSTQTVDNKNFADPSTWTTIPDGGSLPGKSDLIDSYISMRRMGNSVNATNPSHLIVYMAASTVATDGTRYLDFELFRSPIDYDGKGKFINSAPSGTGGRNIWQFEADGSVRTSGDMTLSFAFDNAQVSDIAIYIWIHYSSQTAIVPKGFDFVPGTWSGINSSDGYGYIKIKPKNSSVLPAWGAVNTAITKGPVWGTTSKDLSTVDKKYYSENIGVGQYAEAAIDLTAIGVDAVFDKTFNPCSPAYRRIMIKTRSSDSFLAALQDFAGPFEFLDVPYLSPVISGTSLIDCYKPVSSLKPANYLNSGIYSWSTSGGNITSRTDTAFITVNKPGKYFLKATAYGNCNSNIDSFLVNADLYQPVATAFVEGSIINSGDSVLLKGGDIEASKKVHPLASSKGLLWNWSGPANFKSTVQNAYAKEYGDYRLILTETRNGCTDTAVATVFNPARTTLPISFRSLSVSLNKYATKSLIKWQIDIEDEYLKHFEIQRSPDGKKFLSVGFVYGKQGVHKYDYEDINTSDAAYYRIKAIGSVTSTYSKVVMKSSAETTAPVIYFDKVNQQIIIQCNAKENTALQLQVIAANGQVLNTVQTMANPGNNSIKVPITFPAENGFYIIQVATAQNRWAFKILN